MRPVELFVSFADADRKHLAALVKQLALAEESGALRVWHRDRLRAGELLRVADEKLQAAQVLVLLISADYHAERLTEARAAVARHGRGAHVIPVRVRAAATFGAPYAHIQMLPRDGSTITGARGSGDDAWAEVAAEIQTIVEAFSEGSTPTTSGAARSVTAGPAAFSASSTSPPAPGVPPRSHAPPTPPAVTFPQPVLDAARNGKLALLFGSGLSLGVPGDFPTWAQLPDRLLAQAERRGFWSADQIQNKRDFFKAGHLSLEGMLTELDTIKGAFGGAAGYRAAVGAIFRPSGAAPGDVHRAIAELRVKGILTTNYDLLFEAVSGPPARMAYTWRDADKALADIDEGRPVLFKIHGSAEHHDSLVMTRAEYTEATRHAPYQRALSHLLQSYTFLIVGYGMSDPLDLDLVFGLNASTFGAAAKTHYALMRSDVRPADRDRWHRDLHVQVVTYADHADLPAILRSLPPPP